MDHIETDYLYVTTHEFKSNISKLTRLLERDIYKAILVQRHNQVVGAYITSGVEELHSVATKIRAQNAKQKPPMPYSKSVFFEKKP